jgi:hypothetical protein
VTGFSAVLHPDSTLNILDSVQRVTGRFLGYPTKIMSTAGYATKHILSLIALPPTLKALSRHLTEEEFISLLLMAWSAGCGRKENFIVILFKR